MLQYKVSMGPELNTPEKLGKKDIVNAPSMVSMGPELNTPEKLGTMNRFYGTSFVSMGPELNTPEKPQHRSKFLQNKSLQEKLVALLRLDQHQKPA